MVVIVVQGGEDKFFDCEEHAIYKGSLDDVNEIIRETYYQYAQCYDEPHARCIETIKKYKDKNILEELRHSIGCWYRRDIEYDESGDNFYFVDEQGQDSEKREVQYFAWPIYGIYRYIKQVLGF